MRISRLVFGLFFIKQAIQTHETFMGLEEDFFCLPLLPMQAVVKQIDVQFHLIKTNSTRTEEISYVEVGKNK